MRENGTASSAPLDNIILKRMQVGIVKLVGGASLLSYLGSPSRRDKTAWTRALLQHRIVTVQRRRRASVLTRDGRVLLDCRVSQP